MKMSKSISLLILALVLFAAGSAQAMPIDTSSLDTLKIEESGPYGALHWPGVHLKISKAYDNRPIREIVAGPDVRIDAQVEMYIETPAGVGGLTRITKKDDGTAMLEHVDLAITGEQPELVITKRSSVNVVEVARIDVGLERAKAIPIYAYRVDAKNVALIVFNPGVSVSKADPEICSSTNAPHPCIFGNLTWKDVMVDLTLGPDQRVGQVRGDIVFDKAPKGVTNEPHSFIVNASFSKVGRDVTPVLSLSTHTRVSPPPSEFSEED